jgi:hypothetical protein
MKQTRKRYLVPARIKLKTLLRIIDIGLHGAVLFREAILIRGTLQTQSWVTSRGSLVTPFKERIKRIPAINRVRRIRIVWSKMAADAWQLDEIAGALSRFLNEVRHILSS